MCDAGVKIVKNFVSIIWDTNCIFFKKWIHYFFFCILHIPFCVSVYFFGVCAKKQWGWENFRKWDLSNGHVNRIEWKKTNWLMCEFNGDCKAAKLQLCHRLLVSVVSYPAAAPLCGLRLWYSTSSTVQTAPLTFSTRMKHLWSDKLCRTAFYSTYHPHRQTGSR